MFERVASVPRAVPAAPSVRAFATRRRPTRAEPTRAARATKPSLMHGSHGPSHHPHAWTKFRKICAKAVNPLVHLADKSIRKLLYRDQFQSQYVPTSLGALHAISSPGKGKLPPVVVLHGLSASASEYQPMLHKLKKCSRRVIAIDMPGHGKSPDFTRITAEQFLAAVAEAIDRVTSTPVVLIGHSLGAYTAAHYAAARPNNVRGLVLLAPPGGPVSRQTRRDTVRLFEARSLHDTVYVTARAFPRNWIMWPILGTTMQERLMRSSLQVLIHSNMEQMFLPAQLLRNMQPPTMVFWADKERIIPEGTLPWLRKNLPSRTKFQTIRHMGHSEMALFPRRILRPYLEFAASLK